MPLLFLFLIPCLPLAPFTLPHAGCLISILLLSAINLGLHLARVSGAIDKGLTTGASSEESEKGSAGSGMGKSRLSGPFREMPVGSAQEELQVNLERLDRPRLAPRILGFLSPTMSACRAASFSSRHSPLFFFSFPSLFLFFFPFSIAFSFSTH